MDPTQKATVQRPQIGWEAKAVAFLISIIITAAIEALIFFIVELFGLPFYVAKTEDGFAIFVFTVVLTWQLYRMIIRETENYIAKQSALTKNGS